MNVSKTELSAVLKQVFEGLDFAAGEHESAAEMIVWAQMCGLQGLQDLRLGLPRLTKKRPPSLRCITEDGSHAVIDADHSSCLNCADVITNLAYVKALDHGASSITVLNCHDRKLLIKAMVNSHRSDMACLLHWHDANDPSIVHLVRLALNTGTQDFPNYTVHKVSKEYSVDDSERHSLYIQCSRPRQQLEQVEPAVIAQLQEHSTVFSPETLQDNYHTALNKGLLIEESLWQLLQNLAAVVLVESSEQSRRGAGA
jgi:LDH2 family malate/lactate/ureidoglycolate dehydrogenase